MPDDNKTDFGDTFIPTNAEAAAETGKAEADIKTAEEQAAEELAVEELAKPRDPDGKFAKKEKPDDEGAKIPKARFDEQITKERAGREAAERRAAELEASIGRVQHGEGIQRAIADVATLRKQERAALMDNKEDLAAEISAKADLLNRQIAIAESNQMSAKDKADAIETIRMEFVVERMEEKYPQLAEGSDDYDPDLVEDILDKQTGLMARQRMSPSKALGKAVEYVMRRRAPDDGGEKSGLRAAKGAPDRKAEAVGKNLDAANRQPSNLKVAGMDSDKAGQNKPLPKASEMSLKEWDALPDATKAKLRGDTL